jgi:hypothetical protein
MVRRSITQDASMRSSKPTAFVGATLQGDAVRAPKHLFTA